MRSIFLGRKFLILLLCALGSLSVCDSSVPLVGLSNAAAQEPAKDPAPQDALATLITADELAKLIESKPEDVKILAPGTDLKFFKQGHLPTAQFVHWIDDITDPAAKAKFNNPSRKQFEQ